MKKSNYLPMQNTTVSHRRSMSDVQEMLEETGFESTGQLSKNGRQIVIATYKGAQFVFECNIDAIQQKLVSHSSTLKQREIRNGTPKGRAALLEIKEQSLKVGWRLLTLHVKSICDSIKLGVITPAQGFAGQLLGSDGVPLAEKITESIESGNLTSPELLLLPEVSNG